MLEKKSYFTNGWKTISGMAQDNTFNKALLGNSAF